MTVLKIKEIMIVPKISGVMSSLKESGNLTVNKVRKIIR